MGWLIGYDSTWKRDIGYGVPAYCDHPKCGAEIDRGLACVCGGEPYGGDHGCGLFFCAAHLFYHRPRGEDRYLQLCARCVKRRTTPYKHIAPEHPRWVAHKLTDESWEQWRKENPREVEVLRASRVRGTAGGAR